VVVKFVYVFYVIIFFPINIKEKEPSWALHYVEEGIYVRYLKNGRGGMVPGFAAAVGE
jgi:hypothetical protein